VWCATFLGIGALFLLTPEIHVQWAGFVITTAAMLVCGGFDIVREERVGPPGVFTRGGDHCFETYIQLNANIKDCAFRIADLCIPTPGRDRATTASPVAVACPCHCVLCPARKARIRQDGLRPDAKPTGSQGHTRMWPTSGNREIMVTDLMMTTSDMPSFRQTGSTTEVDGPQTANTGS
jgi:hypothetical protein